MSTVASPATDGATPSSTRPPGFWAVVVLVLTEGTVFLALLSAYFFIRASSPAWPQGGVRPPELGRISVFTVVLLASSVPLFYGEAAIRRGHVRRLRLALLVSFLMGAAFLANQVVEMTGLGFRAGDNAYASLFVVITGLHGLHLLVGVLMSVVVQLKAALGWFDADHHLTVTVFGLYWHFVDAVWIAVFASLYLSAHVR